MNMLSERHLHTLRQEVMRRCPNIDPPVIDALFAQLDVDYFQLFTAPQIAAHVMLLAAVDDQHPMQLRVIPRSATSAEVFLAAYDLFGEFSIITGLMAAYGLNIAEGQVFSYQCGPGRITPWGHTDGGMIIDIFTVEYAADNTFDATVQARFVTQLNALLQLLRRGKLQQAREELNYRLIDAMRTSQQVFSARLFPIDIRIDNNTSPDWTVVDITADDTPAFLYSLSNALTMRNIYIHRVTITSIHGKVQDRLYVGRHRGGKITSEAGQRELHIIVALIKQFTLFLTVAPDPAKALRHFDQFLDRLATQGAPSEDLHWLGEEGPLKALATVLGSSDFLWEDFLRMQHATLLPVLKDMEEMHRRTDKIALASRLQQALQAADTATTRKMVLNTYKDRELFRIDMRHLLHPELPFGSFSEELTDLAEVVVATALTLAQQALQERHGIPLHHDGSPCTFALFGLGKFGGRELGYASDIEMLCVYSGQGTTRGGIESIAVSEYAELLVQQCRDFIVARRSGIFEIDLRLRPFGSHGPLATSVETFQHYYSPAGQAAPFERQALIKLRWVAGDAALGQQIEAHRNGYVYSATPFDLTAAVQLRQRQIQELVHPGTIDTKYGPGGLIDLEYTVQYLQLLHGATTPAVRTPNTLEAQQALYQASHLSQREYQQLREAYVFLRHLIDALRIVRGHARDLALPSTDSEEFIFLARRMGYWGDQRPTSRLATDIAHHMAQAARIYQERFLTVTIPHTGSV
jgi:[glutamine synthetase] adenylyltransferase / [glutamine synthetase]-adenylyl-L-tyrosine phosphorylase